MKMIVDISKNQNEILHPIFYFRMHKRCAKQLEKIETMNCLQKLFPAINVSTKERMFWSSATEFAA